MQVVAAEGRDAAGRGHHRHARIIAVVADQVVAALLAPVRVDGVARAAAGVGQHVGGAVGLVYVVQGAPAGQIGRVRGVRVARADVAGVLVPGELHALLGALDHPLLVEQIHLAAEQPARHLGHQLPEQEAAHTPAGAVAVGDEVAAAAVGDADGGHALLVHDRVEIPQEVGTLFAQHGHRLGIDHLLQDAQSFLAELLALAVADYCI